MQRRWLTSLICCALFTSAAFAAPAAPPDKLTWNDLVNHPERWPASVKLTKMIRFSPTDAIKAGTECRILGVTPSQAQLLADNSQFEAPPDFTNLLDEANAAWAKLTPEQRALTVDAVLKDRSLWPAKVTVNEPQDFGRIKMKAGDTASVVGMEPNHDLKLMIKESVQWLPVPMSMTDFFARARDIAATPKEKRPGRVAGILDGLLVDSDGKPAQVKDADHYNIYWSGSQCEWCAQYNPKWVAYYNKTLADRKDVQVFSMANDKSMPIFYAYAKKSQYAWPILPMQYLAFTEVIGPIGNMIQTPALIVFDKNGTIVASTLRQKGTPLQTADGVIAQIDKMLAEKPAN
jgi:hypothetical protein